MRRTAVTTGALIAVLSLTGAVQIHLIDYTPPIWLRLTALLLVLLLLALRFNDWRSKSLALPSTMRHLRANGAPGRKSPYIVVKKELAVRVADAGATGATFGRHDYRRSALFAWSVRLRNTSRDPVRRLELPIVGEIQVDQGDLRVRAEGTLTGTYPTQLLRRDGYSPTIVIELPAPGLTPGAEAGFEYSYVWPGVAHLRSDHWIFDLRGAVPGGVASLTLSYPSDMRQQAVLRRVYRRIGLLQAESLGSVHSTDPHAPCFRVDYTVKKGDVCLLLDTHTTDEPWT